MGFHLLWNKGLVTLQGPLPQSLQNMVRGDQPWSALDIKHKQVWAPQASQALDWASLAHTLTAGCAGGIHFGCAILHTTHRSAVKLPRGTCGPAKVYPCHYSPCPLQATESSCALRQAHTRRAIIHKPQVNHLKHSLHVSTIYMDEHVPFMLK